MEPALADRLLVLVGPFPDEARRHIHEAATTCAVTAHFVGGWQKADAHLQGAQPLAIILRMDGPAAAQECAEVRSHSRLAQVPIFGVGERNDLTFTELFVWGGDDLVGLASSQPIVRRLRALRTQRGATPMKEGPPNAKQAVVAGADATWRKIMGRSLHHGGFTVRFAQSADEIAVDARVVVAADDLLPAGALVALADARAHGSTAAWVLVVPPKGVAAANAQTASLGGASTVDGFGPPENALFVVNELLAGRAVNQRASPRLLYGTTIAFRAAGRDEDEVGFSYNVSAGGLYVRTLAPLEPGDETWLEMWSPRSERRVRLLGTVAWRRAFGPTGGATVPPGFGVKITGGLGEDWERWVAGCQRFADNLGLSVPPPPTSEP